MITSTHRRILIIKRCLLSTYERGIFFERINNSEGNINNSMGKINDVVGKMEIGTV